MRATHINHELKVRIIKEEFSKLIVADISEKLSKEFEMHIKDITQNWVAVHFIHQNKTASWDNFVDVTDLLKLRAKK